MKSLRVALIAAILTAPLAACGGGGGGSSAPSVIPSAPTQSARATLKSGFSTAVKTSGAFRATKALSATLVPVADFVVPDAYVSYKPFLVTSATAVAYYDTSNGGTIPNPLPTGTWTQSGIPVSTSSVAFGANLLSNPASVSSEQVAQPTTTGKALLTFTTALGDSTTLTAFSYGGAALDDKQGGGYAGSQPCVTFTALGSTPVATGGDLCLQVNADHTTSIVAPHGAVLVKKPVDQVTLADAAGLPTTSTTLGSATIATDAGQDTIVANTALGGVVKYQPIPVSCGCQGGGTTQGFIDYLFGYYRVTASGSTPFDE